MSLYPQINSNLILTQLPYTSSQSFETVVQEVETGMRWSYPRRAASLAGYPTDTLSRFQLNYPMVTDDEVLALKTFFQARRGRWQEFRFLDPNGNLLQYSEDFSQSYWDKSNGPVTVGAAVADPFRTTHATTLTGGGSDAFIMGKVGPSDGQLNGVRMCASVWVKTANAGKSLSIGFIDSTATRHEYQTYALSQNSWQRISFSYTLWDNNYFRVVIGGQGDWSGGDEVAMYGAQVVPMKGEGIYAKSPGNYGYHEHCRFDTDSFDVRHVGPNQNSLVLPVSEFNSNLVDILDYLGEPITPVGVVQIAKATSVLTLPGGDLGPGTVGLISVSATFAAPVTGGNSIIVAVAGRVLHPGSNITGGPRPGVAGSTAGGALGTRTYRVAVSLNIGLAETAIGAEASVSVGAGTLFTMTSPNPNLGTLPGADSWNLYINGGLAQGGIAPGTGYTEPSGGAGGGGSSAPGSPVPSGFTFTELIWADGGVGGSQFGGEAMGIYVARNVAGGTIPDPGTVTFIAAGFNGNPLIDNDADLCLIIVEVSPIPAITGAVGGAVQQGNSTSDLSVSVSSGGFTIVTDFGSHTRDAGAFGDMVTGAGHHFAAILTGDDIPGTPADPTISIGSTPYTLIDSVTSSNLLPLYLWLI